MSTKNEGSNGKKEKESTPKADTVVAEFTKENKKLKADNVQLKKKVKQLENSLKDYELTDAEKLGIELGENESIYNAPNGKQYIQVINPDGSKSLFTLGLNGEKREPV